jgi:hypothetical protein
MVTGKTAVINGTLGAPPEVAPAGLTYTPRWMTTLSFSFDPLRPNREAPIAEPRGNLVVPLPQAISIGQVPDVAPSGASFPHG